MHIFSRLGLSTALLLAPLLALAAPPQSVTGITAALENGDVRVTWNQVSNTDIASYRIFYSHASILQNGGLYDDFESADGTVNTHLIQNIPPTSELFVSILAVNTRGEESPYFVEEAKVNVGSAQQASSNATTPAPTAPAEGEFRLMAVDAESATGIVLRFSHPVSIPQSQATQAISIETASGTKLLMRRYVIQDTNVTIHTETQTHGAVYKVTVSPLVTARDAMGKLLSLASDQSPMLFSGHPNGLTVGQTTPSPIVTTPTPASPAANNTKADVTQLRLRAQPDGVSTYSVESTWQAPVGNLVGYQIFQTTDGGRSYSAPQSISADKTGSKTSGVPAGSFGIMVKAVYADGISNGIAQVITLPGTSSNPNQGSVAQPKPIENSDSLPNSGPTLWIVTMGVSGMIGAWKMREKKRV